MIGNVPVSRGTSGKDQGMTHTLRVEHGDPPQEYAVLHDGAWPVDGDVVIILNSARAEQFSVPGHDGPPVSVARVTIPFAVLVAAVADAVRSRRIERLESQDDADLLGLSPAEAYRDDRRRRLSAARSDIAQAVGDAWEKHGLTVAEIHAAVERVSHDMAQQVLAEAWDRQGRTDARKRGQGQQPCA